jgi:predicted nucleic acid-binding protein
MIVFYHAHKLILLMHRSIATALSGKAHYLVTHDEKLQAKVKQYKGVVIVSPPVFLQRLREEKKKAA